MVLHKVSQQEKEEGGGKWGVVRGAEERWREEEAKGSGVFPRQIESHFSCVIFSPSHIYMKIPMALHQNIWNQSFTC